MALFVVLAVNYILFGIATAKLGCMDEKNAFTDWYILYKLPKDSQSDNDYVRVGEAYANLNAKTGTWSIPRYGIDDEASRLSNTYSQLTEDSDIAYILYNDQMPGSNASTSHWGHTKGMVATDGETGFWLSHSIPRFPLPPDEGYYDYPDNAKSYGQSAICISFNAKELPKIIRHLSFAMPKIYASHYTEGLDSQPEEVQNFFSEQPAFVRKPPFNSVDEVSSAGGQKFTIVAKHGKWDRDLYNSSVSQILKASLYVESWMSGAGNKLTSDCDKVPFSVMNVNAIKMQVGKQYVSFTRTQDHSKWAATMEGFQPWVCIGDINRMESQFKRGGGTICVKSTPVWRAFHSSIEYYEDCPV